MPELPHYDLRLTAGQVNTIAAALGHLPLNAERQHGTMASLQQQVQDQERIAARPPPPDDLEARHPG